MGLIRPPWPCVAVALSLVAGAGQGPVPIDLGVRVTFASGALQEDDLGDQLSVVLIDELRTRGCFRSVVPVNSDERAAGRAVLKIRVDEHWTRTVSDIGIVQQQRAEHPDDRLRYGIEETLEAEVGLLIEGTDSPKFSKPFRSTNSQRPRFEGDDPGARARAEILDHFAERVGSLTCKESRSLRTSRPSTPDVGSD